MSEFVDLDVRNFSGDVQVVRIDTAGFEVSEPGIHDVTHLYGIVGVPTKVELLPGSPVIVVFERDKLGSRIVIKPNKAT